jgi:hypothetical protein
MKNFKFLILFMILVFTLPYIYGGCGGGGGSDSPSGIVYSGLTTPATLTDSNAEEISSEALSLGLDSDEGMIPMGVNQGSTEHHPKNFDSVQIPLILRKAFKLNDFSSFSSAHAATHSYNFTVYDSDPDMCGVAGDGGYFSVTGSFNDLNNAFSGSFRFVNFGCEGESQMNGLATFSGEFDDVNGEFVRVTFNFINLTGGEFNLHGSISIDNSDPSREVMTFNATGQDPISGKIFKIENYIITIYDYGTYVEIEMSGNFYDPDHGYVTLSTDPVQILVIDNGYEWPSSGILILTGAGDSKVRLTALNNTTCRIEVDADDGDNLYEDLWEVDWVDL